MNNSDLEKIIAIAEEGSMLQASQRLFLTQPALSRALGNVEDELGERLFTRHSNGLTPTDAGAFFLQKARQILKLHDEISAAFCELNNMQRGTLHIASAGHVGSMSLPRALRVFREKFPRIRIDVVDGDSAGTEELVLSGAVDMGIVMLPLPGTVTRHRVFNREPYLIAVPAGHPLNECAISPDGKEPYIPEDALRGAQLVLTARKKSPRRAIVPLLERLGGDYDIVMETHNGEMTLRYVEQGFGISIVPGSFSRVFPGSAIHYYRMEPDKQIWEEWAAIFCKSEDNLTRPSRELLKILCESPGMFSA